jgi:hypothetical protein
MSLRAAESDNQNSPAGQPPPEASQPPAQAANAVQTAPATQPAPVLKKQELGRWWERSSRDYSPLVHEWLFHAEGTLSYMNAAGNTSGSTIDTTDRLDVRKDRCTLHSFVQWNRQNMTYGFGQGAVKYTQRTLREQMDCDATKTLMFVVGVEDYQNTLWYMDKRLKVYVGGAATLFEDDKHQLTFTGGVGRVYFTFDRARIEQLPFPVNIDYNPSSGGALGIQTWRWRPSSHFVFNEVATYMKYFDAYLGYNWAINLSADVPLNKWIAFNVTYRVQDQANSIVKALRVFEQDRAFLLGIKASI